MTSGDSSSSPPLDLAIVVSHPIQYYSPWFRWLRANTALRFKVFYLSDFGLRAAVDVKFKTSFAWDVDLTSGYDWKLVPNVAKVPDTLRFNGLNNPELFPLLAAEKPRAVLLFGYKYRTHLQLIAWARLHRVPLIFRGDSHLLDRPRFSTTKLAALTLLYRQFAAVTYVGHANRDYFLRLGVAPEKLFFAPHAVDTSLFRESDSARQGASALRAELNIPRRSRILLFAGKLIPSKQPKQLLLAFLRSHLTDTVLVLSGDGPEKEELKSLAANADDRVKFLGFANQSEMPTRYAMADVFVLPSRGSYETWGLAINEAMSMGIPCIVSNQVGCQQDLVTDGSTGWVFASGDSAALTRTLEHALQTPPEELAAMRTRIRERMTNYTYARAAAGLGEAISHAVSHG